MSITIARGLFVPESLRKLEIKSGNAEPETWSSEDTEESDIHEIYADRIAKEIGLDSFRQFAFLQLFIFTFDERRHLLFWDQEVLQQCLYLTFGLDAAAANKADILNRESQKQDSLARNCNYQANELRKKIEDIRKTTEEMLAENDFEDVGEQYKRLEAEIDEQQKKVAATQNKLDDANLSFSEFSAKYSVLKDEYAKEFEKQMETYSPLGLHPLIVGSLSNKCCQLCGAAGEKVFEAIKNASASDHCALCGSEVEGTRAQKKDFDKLRQVDKKIHDCKESIDLALKTIGRVRLEHVQQLEALTTQEKKRHDFEKNNRTFLDSLNLVGANESTTALIERYKASMNEQLEKKAAHYKKRNEKRKELSEIQKTLEKKYLAAKKEFVPLFKDLAENFLGLDLEIELKTKDNSPGMTLELKVEDTKRRETHQLSESQRFFVDIALRMALARYASDATSKACIFVDTPEGSLDIAYESRAGEMLSKFVGHGHQLVLTANINSSKLVNKLAEMCGKAKMKLCRMTLWASLSDVQIAEENLFEKAFKDLEKALSLKKGA